ncbi:unnamed protein product [Closterium sp. Naga37s-1]|nr:unnamed protein product [Closterium sp. Naga37s-1]
MVKRANRAEAQPVHNPARVPFNRCSSVSNTSPTPPLPHPSPSPPSLPPAPPPSLHSLPARLLLPFFAATTRPSAVVAAARCPAVVAAAAAATPTVAAAAGKTAKPKKKVDSAVKRAKQAEVRRVYNKSRKTEMSTRMKKAFLALEELSKSASPSEEQLLAAEKLISEAFSIIDRSVKVNAIHQNKGARRKARLSRAKRATLVSLGWYTPEPAAA